MLGSADVIQHGIFYDGEAVAIAPPFGEHGKRRTPHKGTAATRGNDREIDSAIEMADLSKSFL